MTDRELLEAAARAANIDIFRWPPKDSEDFAPLINTHKSPISIREWNPLTDDGDALRLAVKLQLGIDTDSCTHEKASRAYWVTDGYFIRHESDPYAATRRAIVCAAAAIAQGAST